MITREQLLTQADDWAPPPVIPYVWGGMSRRGADCSGFIVAVLNELNASFRPGVRTAEQIRQECTPVSPNEARPGDLIFFENTYDHPETIDRWGPDGHIATHIGFVVDWGYPTRMLDTHDYVKYSPITSYWEQHFLGVARMPQITDEEENDMSDVTTFVGNALADDGEIQNALRGIEQNVLESDMESAQQNIDALQSRIEQLWKDWNGE